MIDFIDALQWPAMAVTVAAAWLVASRHPGCRRIGFYSFLVSNVLWVTWGWNDGAYALIALQCCLAVSNARGLYKSASAPE